MKKLLLLTILTLSATQAMASHSGPQPVPPNGICPNGYMLAVIKSDCEGDKCLEFQFCAQMIDNPIYAG